MNSSANYKPTKLVLHCVVPKIIKAYRLPGMSDGSAGRRQGDANLDELAGAHDILYHLMSTQTIAVMADHLGISRQRVYDAIDIGLHSIDGDSK